LGRLADAALLARDVQVRELVCRLQHALDALRHVHSVGVLPLYQLLRAEVCVGQPAFTAAVAPDELDFLSLALVCVRLASATLYRELFIHLSLRQNFGEEVCFREDVPAVLAEDGVLRAVVLE
jgi:hypothetical protein